VSVRVSDVCIIIITIVVVWAKFAGWG